MCAYTSFLNFSNTIHHGQPICTSILTENNNEKNNNCTACTSRRSSFGGLRKDGSAAERDNSKRIAGNDRRNGHRFFRTVITSAYGFLLI